MWTAKAAGGNAYQLYGNDTTGGTVRRRNLDLNPGENVLSFRISPSGSQVVYDVGKNNQFSKGNLYQTNPLSGASHILTVADPEFGIRSYDFAFRAGESASIIYSCMPPPRGI
jgi:hypothetical protein